MKIAILSVNLFDDSIGGVENHILYISRELIKRGHKIVCFKPVWEDKYKEAERKWDEQLTIVYINLGKRPYDLRRWSGQGKSGKNRQSYCILESAIGLATRFFLRMVGDKETVQPVPCGFDQPQW
jgi:hypothetical protein